MRSGPKRRHKNAPWQVVSYTSCPFCACWSLGVMRNGRIVRHAWGGGSVDAITRRDIRRGSVEARKNICTGSGRRILADPTPDAVGSGS